MTTKTIITITGPTCGGKSTLENLLLRECPTRFTALQTVATRPPRNLGDVYYKFITKEEFIEMVNKNLFVEHNHYGAEYYGTTISEISEKLALDKTPLKVIDPNGRRQIETYAKENSIKLFRIYIGINRMTQFERLLKRFKQEMDGCEGLATKSFREHRECTERKMKTYAERMANIIDTESDWNKEVLSASKNKSYDHVIPQFDIGTEEVVVKEILSKL